MQLQIEWDQNSSKSAVGQVREANQSREKKYDYKHDRVK